mmetsp:Transcript_12389/g.37804  ORF Transcript_12389/g.37804 Transcript_12389/m.37804 type:complete len:339 (-) Transcript_12389:3370-4386(-)
MSATVGKLYSVLGIADDADEASVRSAYRRLAKRWHPDRNLGNREEAELRFKEIAQAYQVLSDPRKRQVYDEHGMDGLEDDDDNNNNLARKQKTEWLQELLKMDPLDFSDNMSFSSSFESFTTGSNPDFSFGDTRKRSEPNPFSIFGLFNGKNICEDDFSQHKAEDQYVNCFLTLEEFYRGARKFVKIKRRVWDAASNQFVRVWEDKEFNVPAGAQVNSTIRLHGAGDESPINGVADVVLVLKEKPHQVFKRKNNDLHCVKKISLADAFEGQNIIVDGLDKRRMLNFDDLIYPGYVARVKHAGFPIAGTNMRGDLVVTFDVVFPRRVPLENRRKIRKLL